MPQPPDTVYRKRFPSVRELNAATDPPESAAPPPGSVVVKAGGLKFTLPMALVLTAMSGVIGAVGARALPTPSTQDTRLAEIQQQIITSELGRARDTEEQRRQFAAQEERLRQLATQVSVLEVQISSLQRKAAAP